LIIWRLVELLEGLTITLTGTGASGSTPSSIPAGNFVHNRNELPAEKVPGFILLDADEVNDPRMLRPPPGQAAMRMADQLIKMTPEIYVVLDVRKPNNINVGDDLELARLMILGAIWTDSVLWNIVGNNGNIVYDGCVTDLARSRVVRGQMGISVTFTYPLKVSEIVGV